MLGLPGGCDRGHFWFCYNAGIMKKLVLPLCSLILLLTSACGNQAVATQSEPVVTATNLMDDPCAAPNLPTTVQELVNLMSEFDNISQQVPGASTQQYPSIISELQRVRRAAEDTQIPPCLGTLKTHQLNHMNLMIQTLIAFVGGTSQEELNAGLENARKEHDLYSLEIVRLLGITLAPLTPTVVSP